MALFSDGGVSSIEDLLGYESSILDVARTEGIDLPTKLELAEEEVGIELTAFLVQQVGSKPALENVVVTEALHKWHVFQTLALIYRDAYNRQLNDRYLAKWKECDRLAKWASTMLFQAGVGIVDEPIPRAERPELGTVAGPLGAATYYVRVSWLNESGDEGAPSELGILTAQEGTALTVRAVNPPADARGWNLYAGFSHADLTLQNTSPLPPNETWVESSAGLQGGRKPGAGQEPDYYVQAGGGLRRESGSGDVGGRLLRG